MLAPGLLGSLLVGCASTLDPPSLKHSEYESNDAELALVEEFSARAKRCRRSGGYMVLPMGHGGKIDRSTMTKAHCDRNWRGLKGVLYD